MENIKKILKLSKKYFKEWQMENACFYKEVKLSPVEDTRFKKILSEDNTSSI